MKKLPNIFEEPLKWRRYVLLALVVTVAVAAAWIGYCYRNTPIPFDMAGWARADGDGYFDARWRMREDVLRILGNGAVITHADAIAMLGTPRFGYETGDRLSYRVSGFPPFWLELRFDADGKLVDYVLRAG